MDEYFKNNPNMFSGNNKYNSLKRRPKTNLNINDNNQNYYHVNQNRYSAKYYNHPENNNQNKPKAFIIGKFGRKTVVSQDLNTFLNKIKKAEWTTNPSYLIAKDINVKPNFANNDNKNNDINMIKYSNTIDKLYLHLNKINFNDYLNYVNEIKTRNHKLNEEAKKEKEEFMKTNFPNEGKMDLKSILNRIRNNHKSFISKDQILYNKISQQINNY